ncbi:efflux transporter outer membrane subunit [Variovorax sp. RCC_210]|uniref:efflux transporter outer membrane subunit n=1 Tax=Variovorax sp. RCC_210 TaxID=3239217 RepID=UPI003524874B
MRRFFQPLVATAATVAAAWLVSGCATASPPTTTPVAAAPDAAARRDAPWWRSFGSTELDALVEQAATQSLDVAAAAARVRQAEASARMAGAALWPGVTAGLDAARQGRMGGEAQVAGDSFAASLGASYELDFWGGNRAAQHSALAGLRASAFARDTVRLTTTAGVANAWLQAVSLRERAAIGTRNLDNAQRVLALVDSRARAGAATPLELAQQRGLVASQQRTLAALHQQADDARTALAVLSGQSAFGFAAASLDGLREPGIGAGLPSDLLARRPDIARAEALLDAADADIAVARAAMLPRVTLGAGVGWSAGRLRALFDSPVYSLAAGLAAPIFDAGRLAAGRDLAVARREELLAGYRAAVVAAFGDAATALDAVAGIDRQRDAQAEELRQAQRAFTLAQSRYKAGAETLLVLLDAQRTLYAAQDAAVQLKAQRLQASVALYRALGGGWAQQQQVATTHNRETSP